MIMDACVLIDFFKADPGILLLIARHIGPLYIVSPIVDEVKEIQNEEELADLGLIVIEPELEDAYLAAGIPGALSFQDWLCLFTARRHGFTCVTNDINLRKQCGKEKIPLLWGLQLLIELHESAGIPAKRAIELAWKIHRSNPKHITPKIVEDFIKIIHKQR